MEAPEFQPDWDTEIYPGYYGRRLPAFRHSAWEDITAYSRGRLRNFLTAARSLFPLDLQSAITDIQIVGSQAHGTAHEGSDIDVVFVVPADQVEQWRALVVGAEKYRHFLLSTAHLRYASQKLGVRIEWSVGPDARGLCCYSVADDRLYGRAPGEVLRKRVSYNLEARVYEFVPFTEHLFLGV